MLYSEFRVSGIVSPAIVHQFVEQAKAIFSEQGLTTSNAAIAAFLGVPPSTLNNALAGGQRLPLDVLRDWFSIWNARMPALALYMNETGGIVFREDWLAKGVGYVGDDLLGHIGDLVNPRVIQTAEGPVRIADLPVAVEQIEFVNGFWQPRGHVPVNRKEVLGWAYFGNGAPVPGGRSAIRLYLTNDRVLDLTYTDGPLLMRHHLRVRAERRPDIAVSDLG